MEEKLLQALDQLIEAMLNLDDVWGKLPNEQFNIVCEKYPFDKDFLELTYEVKDWRYHIKERLQEAGDFNDKE